MRYRLFILTALLLTIFTHETFSKTPPRLVVNIIVSSMGNDDIHNYTKNLSPDGFLRLVDGGAVFTNSYYDYQQTTTPVSLATITTGAMPSTHGVVGESWCDYVKNDIYTLIGEAGEYNPDKLLAPTIGEALLSQSAGSQSITIAADPESAIVAAGKSGKCYWLDPMYCLWATSPYYEAALPEWVEKRNKQRMNLSYLEEVWRTIYPMSGYVNSRRSDIKPSDLRGKKGDSASEVEGLELSGDLEKLLYTPAGNTAIFDFAKAAIMYNKLGSDATPDLLTICLDPARYITEGYGPESVEVEDMYYRLDRDLSDFLTFTFAQVKDQEILVVLTSDHGSSPSVGGEGSRLEPFNTRQFEIIVNSFLNVRYGVGKWVVKYQDKSIYLNHNLVYEKGLDLADVQDEVATFVMQFDGVSHALSSTAMRHSYFGSGYARKIQNGFYPRRSGDVIINLIPGLIELRDRTRSTSGSMYGYDTKVPLIFYGHNIPSRKIERAIDMTSIAPTIARILDINEPIASEGVVLEDVIAK